MKTKPAKLLMALLLGMGSLTMVSTPAFAGSKHSNSEQSSSGESNDGNSSASTPTPTGCTGKWVVACGITVFQTTCTGTTMPAGIKSEENDDDDHHHSDHDSRRQDSHDHKNDRDRNDDSHKDHADHSHDAVGSKVSICHRMGGDTHDLLVANDGWLSGHSKHVLDTIGRCDDFEHEKDDDTKKDSDSKISASDAGYSAGLTPSLIACLKGASGNTYPVGETPYPGAGLNSPNTTFTFPSTGPSQGPSRGGARTLH